MKRIPICALILSAPFATVANSQTTAWLCIADRAVGFSNSSGSWSSANFRAGDKYIIKASQQQGVAWEVRQFGNQGSIPDATCRQTFTTARILNCVGLATDFHFNAATSRFMRIYSGGYWTYIPGDKWFGNDADDTPYIEIGTCSAI